MKGEELKVKSGGIKHPNKKKNDYICTLKPENDPENRGVAQLASVLAWGARGRKFESSHPDLIKIKRLLINRLQPFF